MWLVVLVVIDRGCGNNVKAVAICGWWLLIGVVVIMLKIMPASGSQARNFTLRPLALRVRYRFAVKRRNVSYPKFFTTLQT